MGKKGRAAIWVVALSVICGLIIWHAVHWHFTGMYLEMFNWIGTDRAYMTVLYNLGLMVVLGALLGFLMEKITGLIC
ncbi:hypothetical protein ES703_121821 [subsurface metagenome]